MLARTGCLYIQYQMLKYVASELGKVCFFRRGMGQSSVDKKLFRSWRLSVKITTEPGCSPHTFFRARSFRRKACKKIQQFIASMGPSTPDKCGLITIITHLDEARIMTLQTQHPTPEHSPAVLTDEQRRRVADALENAQSENTRRNYAGQYRKFRAWCEREDQSALPAQPEVLAAYAAELAEDGKRMSTIRLAVAAIVDAHRSVGLESPQTTGVTETLRGLSRQARCQPEAGETTGR